MEELDPNIFIDRADYRVQYADYEEGCYTVWCRLTAERLENTLNDLSVTKVQIKPDDNEVIYDLDVI